MIALNQVILDGSAPNEPIKRTRGQHREGCVCNICKTRAASKANPRETKPLQPIEEKPKRPITMSEAPDIIKATAHAEKTVQAKLAELAKDKGKPAPKAEPVAAPIAPIVEQEKPFELGKICRDAFQELENFWNE